ncbi:MAG: queuosine precursor transporter [Candidatus Paceibacterota bacterium]|jgi:hypothetical protein
MEKQSEDLSFSPKIIVALTIYVTSLFAANSLGIKLMPFLFGTQLSVAVFCFPVVFIMTDIIGEVYGKRMAKFFVWAGFISIILFLFYSFLSAIVPWGDRALWVKDGYNQIFGVTARMSIASLLAFIIAEYQDVISFFFLRNKFGTKNFWLRSNLSNIWSQFLDSSIFMFVAFLGIYPVGTIVLIILPWWIYKIVMGFCYTPLSYLGIRLLGGRVGVK